MITFSIPQKTPMDNIIKNSTACNDLNDKIHFQIRFRIQPYYALIEIAYFCYKNITKETFQNKICSDSELLLRRRYVKTVQSISYIETVLLHEKFLYRNIQ